jgi:outer membrane lipoprotein-sorting protein
MCDVGRRWILVIALIVLFVTGCATAGSPPVPSDAGAHPAAETTTNFASPTDMLQRYPTMRRQQL